MADMGSSLIAGKKLVVAAGTRVQIETSGKNFAGKSVVVQALPTNEGEIVVGDNTVVAAPGTHGSPTQIGVSLAAKGTIAFDLIDATQVWLDATKSGDGVAYVVLAA